MNVFKKGKTLQYKIDVRSLNDMQYYKKGLV